MFGKFPNKWWLDVCFFVCNIGCSTILQKTYKNGMVNDNRYSETLLSDLIQSQNNQNKFRLKQLSDFSINKKNISLDC
jgi:hypothetical protein